MAAWMTYWQGATDTYYAAHSVPRPWRPRHRGQARAAVLDYLGGSAEAKQQRGRRLGPGTTSRSVTVDGDTATVRDCTENFTFNVDADGDAVTNPDPVLRRHRDAP